MGLVGIMGLPGLPGIKVNDVFDMNTIRSGCVLSM